MSKTFTYLCECRDESCHRQIVMPVARYRELSLWGTIVTAECAERQGAKVLRDHGHFVVTSTSRQVDLATRVDRDLWAY